MKILIADDNMFMRTMLANEIKLLGHEVIGQALDGKEAEELYFDLKPDVMTMDMTMPVVDGIEAAKAILARDPNAKIIMLTGMKHSDNMIEALKLGATDFIVKPLNIEQLKAALSKIERNILSQNIV